MKKKDMLDQFLIDLANQTYRLLVSKGASHHEAEDVVQDTLYKLIKLLPELNHNQLKPWFFRVALNGFIDNKRKTQKTITVEQSFFHYYQENVNHYNRVINLEQIEIKLDSIKKEYREILLLKYYYDLSYIEISEILNIKQNSVKQKLARARKSILDNKE
ncbi:RNA polymerase sigma factor [Vagococcus fluvialis]|uniref:RNA polymerase sigma factor n=1 Tax=Vagococcus fluvialis TaxID=2738 RepID=UPI003B5AAD06